MTTTFPKLRGPLRHGGLTLGENSYINGDSIIIPCDGHTIRIGANCAIGHWVYMSNRMHKTENHQEWFSGDIVIEDDCWLGNGVVVYPNVTIGKGSVVGAHCVVTNDIPPAVIVYIPQAWKVRKR